MFYMIKEFLSIVLKTHKAKPRIWENLVTSKHHTSQFDVNLTVVLKNYYSLATFLTRFVKW